MGKQEKSAYAQAGVDIDAASDAVNRMKKHILSTQTSDTLTGIGPFGGLFDASLLKKYQKPVLVHTIDGVGTKIMVAQMMNQWTVGQDIVNHCVNDVLAMGARPFTFLDYLGAAKLKPAVMEKIVEQMAIACRRVEIPIISGETAEMPGVYKEGCHDIVGCVIGIVEKDGIIDGSKIAEGDTLLGLSSNGLHTNGYSLARKAFFEIAGWDANTLHKDLDGSIGQELLRVHRCYLEEIVALQKAGIEIHGIAHITGGGFFDNIGRLLPEGLYAEISERWRMPAIFRLIQKIGNVSDKEMRRVFNLGIGMVLITPPENLPVIADLLARRKASAYPMPIGEIKRALPSQKEKVVFTY